MTRYRQTATSRIAFTEAEEAAWDAQEAAEKLPSALNAFRTARDGCLTKGIQHDGQLWHTDALSQHAMSSAIMLGEKYEAATAETFSTIWKTLSGTTVVGIPELVSAGLAVGACVQAAFQREAELIDKAEGGDVDGAMAEIGDGWPEVGA